MNDRDNLLGIIKKTGYEYMPVHIEFTPSIGERFQSYCNDNNYNCSTSPFYLVAAPKIISRATEEVFRAYHPYSLKEGTVISPFGVANEPANDKSLHFTHFRSPLARATSLTELQNFPFPTFETNCTNEMKSDVTKAHSLGKFALGGLACTIWETAWSIRGMEELLMDMLTEPEMAEFMLDKMTEKAINAAKNYASAGVDGIWLGDDIGMQKSIMMSVELYCKFLKPRLAKVIAAAKQINPEIIIFYHSCGYITPFIPHLIEVGIEVLDPIQPECMDFEEIYNEFGDRLSFHGTLGTQTLFPFGTPADMSATIKHNLDLVGKKGGLIVAPSHVIEPEVPIENIISYIESCKAYKPN